MRDTTALAPLPKINATRLKSKIPTSNHTSAPIITNEKAIIEVIFISFPLEKVFAKAEKICKNYTKRFSKTNLSKSISSIKSALVKRTLLYFA